MEIQSFYEEIVYSENYVTSKLILESDFSKELRLLFRKNQLMKAHKTKFSIVVQVLEGKIDFGVHNKVHHMKRGDIIIPFLILYYCKRK